MPQRCRTLGLEQHGPPPQLIAVLQAADRPGAFFDAWLIAEVAATLALADWSAAATGRSAPPTPSNAVALELEAYAARRLELSLTGAAR
jgi:hypothetical protein